ncbi:hypothetical protein D3C73_1527960 [compost metagenome]
MENSWLVRIGIGVFNIVAFALIIPALLMKRQCIITIAVFSGKADKYILSGRLAGFQIEAACGSFEPQGKARKSSNG